MTYTKIFMMLLCTMVLPYLVVGLIALVSIHIPPLPKRKFKPSREALIIENRWIREQNRELKREVALLMTEINKLRGI